MEEIRSSKRQYIYINKYKYIYYNNNKNKKIYNFCSIYPAAKWCQKSRRIK